MPTNNKAFKELIQSIGKVLVITNPVELISYEIDGALKSGTPEVVVLPRSVQDINHILRWANKHDMPVIAWGAGTGLAGAAVAENGGLVLS
jgi:FAD/FMN-containing dehydrogenase